MGGAVTSARELLADQKIMTTMKLDRVDKTLLWDPLKPSETIMARMRKAEPLLDATVARTRRIDLQSIMIETFEKRTIVNGGAGLRIFCCISLIKGISFLSQKNFFFKKSQ